MNCVKTKTEIPLVDSCQWLCVTGDQMLTDDQKKKAQLMREANPDMIYLNDVDFLVSHIVVSWVCDTLC